MDCSRCGREIPGGVRFCPYCGGEVAQGASPVVPVPPGASAIPSSGRAAAEDRHVALMVTGILTGTAILLAVLALFLMVLLSDGSSKKEIRITMVPVGEASERDMALSEEIIGQRLKAMGIDGYDIRSDSGKLVVGLPGMQDVDRVKRVISSTARLQFRQVLEVLGAGEPAYETTEVTGVDHSDQRAYLALEDREIVLEKTEGGSTYKIRLGPTRLTGDIIADARALEDRYSSGRWIIDFTLTYAATAEFADLTGELSRETEPENQLAIVLDYQVMSFPRVNEAVTGGKGQITGRFTEQEAEDLALMMRLGALPVDFTTPVIEDIDE